MLNLLYDFLPVLLFFLAFKFYGIYVATVVGIVATALQVIITTLWKKKLDKKQLITLAVFTLFGGMTLYFHNPMFIKWKPTVIFWIFALVLFISHFVGKKPLMHRMLGSILDEKIVVPASVWIKLSYAWIVFFLLLGAVNIYVAYYFSTDTWVNFKFYGILGLLILFSFMQAIYLSRYLSDAK